MNLYHIRARFGMKLYQIRDGFSLNLSQVGYKLVMENLCSTDFKVSETYKEWKLLNLLSLKKRGVFAKTSCPLSEELFTSHELLFAGSFEKYFRVSALWYFPGTLCAKNESI